MERSPELEELTLRMYEAFSRGDSAFIEGLMSRREGVLTIGTDPDEWWGDYASLTRALRAQLEELARASIVPGAPRAYREGSVGWVADRAKFRLPDGAEVPFRTTAVFHQEAGEWRLVQWHTSLGVPNEQAVGKQLTV
jgi:ketosteroid isomerase-like protein